MVFRSAICMLLLVVSLSCTDKSETAHAPDTRIVSVDSSSPDVTILDWEPPIIDMSREELCAPIQSSEVDEYCSCFPQCCDRQRWFCPPNPRQSIDVMEVTVEVCNEEKVPCIYGRDEGCPPPEILRRGDCYTAWECPPGTSGEVLEWFECQLEDGTLGRQQVLCDKGNLLHLPCQACEEEVCDGEDNDCDDLVDEGRYPCENDCGPGWGFCINQEVIDCSADDPGEERCNYEDDDCDGQVDEGQRNVCDACGPVPADTCDADDNDCDGSTDEDLVRECVTACGRGVETCELGNWISCTAQQPSDEECDGEDNDCDGRIDEQLDCLCTVNDVGVLMPCSEPPLLCGQGFKTCECVDPGCQEMRLTDCAALCTYLPLPEPPVCNPLVGITLENEECNNFDDDCDETIDEHLSQACYTGPRDTLFVGVCVPGQVYCNQGTWGSDVDDVFEPGFCTGEVVPSDEICDGADNDCDGTVDFGEEIRDTDILFIVDWSGSMDEEIVAVKIALNRFAAQFSAEEQLQWGLIVAPKEAPRPGKEQLVLVSNISPFAQFLASFAALGSEGMDTGNEMLLDAIYLSIRNLSANAQVDLASTVWTPNTESVPVKENFEIQWRRDTDRIVVLFSDEEEQTYLRDVNDPNSNARPVSEQVVIDALRGALNTKMYAFSELPILGRATQDWEDIVLAGNGRIFELTSNAVSMYNDLMSIVDEACLPRANRQANMSMMMTPNYRTVSSLLQRYDFKAGICY